MNIKDKVKAERLDRLCKKLAEPVMCNVIEWREVSYGRIVNEDVLPFCGRVDIPLRAASSREGGGYIRLSIGRRPVRGAAL